MNLRRLSYTSQPLIQDKQAKWKTKDGTEIYIYEMTHSHIVNCIQMLIKYTLTLEKRRIATEHLNLYNDDKDEVIEEITKIQMDNENYIRIFEKELKYREQEESLKSEFND